MRQESPPPSKIHENHNDCLVIGSVLFCDYWLLSVVPLTCRLLVVRLQCRWSSGPIELARRVAASVGNAPPRDHRLDFKSSIHTGLVWLRNSQMQVQYG